MSAGSRTEVRELAHRQGDGIDVTLLWDPETNGVFVAVVDAREGDRFLMPVSAADALDAFRHPFAYEQSLVTARLEPAPTSS